MSILQTHDLRKYYGSGDTQVRALDGVDLAVEPGEFVAIVGTSGSGKSTLLHMLGGLDRPTAGKVEVDGKDIFALKDEALTIFRRRKIGFVFQSYNLVPVLSVYENIVLPVELDGRRVDQAYLREVVDTLGLGKKLRSLPNQLSGGQQQRVAIARALAANRTRNLVAALAIALTALLFTSLFTIAMSLNEGFQQSSFRQAGGHGPRHLQTAGGIPDRGAVRRPADRSLGQAAVCGHAQRAPFPQSPCGSQLLRRQRGRLDVLHPGGGPPARERHRGRHRHPGACPVGGGAGTGGAVHAGTARGRCDGAPHLYPVRLVDL